MYEVVQCLGRGAAAALYEARAPGAQVSVLLQDFDLTPAPQAPSEPPPICWDPLTEENRIDLSAPERSGRTPSGNWFAREVAAAAAWPSPPFPPIAAAGVAGDRGILVLEGWGESLAAAVERSGPAPEATVRDLIDVLLDALAALHGRSPAIVLGEVRPSNLRLASDGRPRFITFGEARFVDPPHRGLVNRAGSAFTSPERRRNGQEHPSSDVWCVGALLWFLMTGRGPEDRPGLLRSLRPDASEVLEGVVERCLLGASEKRYAGVAELREALAGREPARFDERPVRLVVDGERFEHPPVLPGETVEGEFVVRNDGGGTMAVGLEPEADWLTVNPKEIVGNAETVRYWCRTDQLMPNNSHSSLIRITSGSQIKFVSVTVAVLPVPKLTTTEKAGWAGRLLIPLGAALLALGIYSALHGVPPAVLKLLGY